MKPKWYLSTLIIILTLIGVLCEQQISVPNQEIVLQFTNVEITTQEAQSTLEIVKKQLQDLGAENIQVKEGVTGSLKISYYSDADVAIIKDSLSKEKNLALDYKSHNQDEENGKFPSDENTTTYNLEVHEIQKGHDADWNLNGTFLSELKLKSNRFFSHKLYLFIGDLTIGKKEDIVKVPYILSKNIAMVIDNTSRNIPEVRAGPTC